MDPTRADIRLGYLCNHNCRFCCVSSHRKENLSTEQVLHEIKNAKEFQADKLVFTGGEPTIRNDLIDIVKIAKNVGFSHVQVNTNGLKLAEDVEYCKKLKEEGVNTIYMSFDGVTKKTNPWITQNKKAIDNLRKVNLKIVLVPVLIADKNLKEAGKIIRFALENMDIIRGVNFQPISFCGRVKKIKDENREKQRVDYVKMMEAIEKEFDGQISREDFYPVPFVFPISKLIGLLNLAKGINYG